MRAGWQNAPPNATSKNQISQMCLQVWGQDKYTHLETLTHGRSHENHVLTLDNGQQVVLRISTNGKSLQKQYDLAQKLWQKLPVPRFLSKPLIANGRKHFAFLEFKHGHRMANLERLPPADHAQLGFELGEYLALLHSQNFKQSGEFGHNLKIDKSYDMSHIGMANIFDELLNQAASHGYISTTQCQKYTKAFGKKILILAEWQHHHCLIHSDLNEDNILHDNGHISAILDWEFCLSGHPALDFGKFTRTPYDNCPLFLENLCDSYYLTHKGLPANWHDIASIVDLMAWAEFLSRQNLNPDVKSSAIKKLDARLGG